LRLPTPRFPRTNGDRMRKITTALLASTVIATPAFAASNNQ
jgi:hypothetical protein